MARVNSTLSLLAAGSVALGIKTLFEFKPNQTVKVTPLPETKGEVTKKISFVIAENNHPETASLIADLLSQSGLRNIEVLVNENLQLTDERVKQISNDLDPTPAGWSEIAWICQKLAFSAEGEILVFINPRVLIDSQLFISAINFIAANQISALFVNPKIKNPFNLGYLNELGQNLITINKLNSEAAISPDLFLIEKSAYNKIAGHTRVGANPDLGVGLLKVLQKQNLAFSLVNAGSLATVSDHSYQKKSLTPLEDLATRALTYLVPILVFIFARSKSLKLLGFVGIKLGGFLAFNQLVNYKPIDFQKIFLTPLAALVSIIFDSLAWWRKWKA